MSGGKNLYEKPTKETKNKVKRTGFNQRDFLPLLIRK